MSSPVITAEFVSGVKGRIFALAHHPANFTGRCILVVPAFAEEMNKSRKMVTELAQTMVDHGIGVILVDFYGTGDSEGDFAEADCDTWLHDLAAVDAWASAKGWSIDSLLAIRFGCVIAAKYASDRKAKFKQVILWQPVLDGARALDQFLRIRVAASLMEDTKETVADLKNLLVKGQVVDVAGYGLSPLITQQMAALKLQPDSFASVEKVYWAEVLRSTEATLSMPSAKLMDGFRAAGIDLHSHTVVGEPFWGTTEIACIPELIGFTADVFSGRAVA